VDDVPSRRVIRDPVAARAEPIGALASRFEDDVTLEREDSAPGSAEAAPTPDVGVDPGAREPDARDPDAGTETGCAATGPAPAGVPQTLQ
jgi:hypothetical protein